MNIRKYIKEELDRGPSLDCDAVSRIIIDRLDDTQKIDALEVAMPHLVRSVVVSTRQTAQPSHENVVKPTQKAAKSWKRQAIRENWRRELDAIYSTSAGNKRLGDFNAEELDALAAQCRDLAKSNAIKAHRYEALAELTRESGVDRLADVDADALRDALGGAA